MEKPSMTCLPGSSGTEMLIENCPPAGQRMSRVCTWLLILTSRPSSHCPETSLRVVRVEPWYDSSMNSKAGGVESLSIETEYESVLSRESISMTKSFVPSTRTSVRKDVSSPGPITPVSPVVRLTHLTSWEWCLSSKISTLSRDTSGWLVLDIAVS